MIRVRRLQLRVLAGGRTFGTDIEFSDGLNILRADNTSGKSTCMQAVIFALGLEGMLSPKREVPLPHVMTDEIEVAGKSTPVDESWVELEIQNDSDESMIVRRIVKSAVVDQTLISTEVRAAGESYELRDYFVRRRGAAQNEAGFHRALAAFLGWELPQVTRNDGSEGPLYLECIFPFFYVEQKHGWSGIQARIPTYLQIREVGKRSAEFVLGLDVYQRILRRQRLTTVAQLISAEWREASTNAQRSLRDKGVVLEGIPSRPVDNFDMDAVRTYLADAADWISLEDALSRARHELETLAALPVATVSEQGGELEQELREVEHQILASSVLLSELLAEGEEVRERTQALELRLETLETELQRQQDVITLQKLGGSNFPMLSGGSHCPTCEQRLADGFEITENPMSAMDNVAHLNREIRTFRSLRGDAERLSEVSETRAQTLRSDLSMLRRKERSIKDALTASSETPSIAQIASQIRLSERVSQLEHAEASLTDALRSFSTASASWATNQRELRSLGDEQLTVEDRRTLKRLERVFVEQLHEYGFSSLTPSTIEISPDTYRPVHEGFDLGFDLSASDMVRVIWAYLIAILEVSKPPRGHHSNMLLLDEPRQQETSRLSFKALLTRAATAGMMGSQIIIATSEEQDELESMMAGLEFNPIFYEGGTKILQEISPTPPPPVG